VPRRRDGRRHGRGESVCQLESFGAAAVQVNTEFKRREWGRGRGRRGP
jgi:hypothetical protein